MSAKFTLDGNSGGAVKAVLDLQKALDASGKSAEGAVRPTKALEAAAKSLAGQVDPMVRYTNQMDKLKAAVQGGGLQLSHAEQLAAKYGAQLDKAGRAGDGAFGAGMAANLKSMVMGMGAALGPLTLLKAGFDDIRQAIEAAKNATVEARRGMGSLRQLAGTDAEFQNLKSKAEALFATGSVDSLDQGASAVFSLASAGQLDDKSFGQFAALSQKGIIDPATMARAVKNYQSSFTEAEAGGASAIMQKAFAAAKYSPATVEALLASMPQVAAVSASMGIADEEALAANAVMSASVGENIASTQLRSFLTGTAKNKALAGKSIAERVAYFDAKNLDIVGLQKELGTIEGVGGFQLLSKNKGDFRAAAGDIQRANNDPGALLRRLQFSDPESDAALSGAMIDNQIILQNRRKAAFEELREGIFERDRQAVRDEALGALGTGMSHTAEWMSGWIQDPKEFVDRANRSPGALTDQQQEVLESLNRSANANERTAEEIRKLTMPRFTTRPK